MARSRPSSSHGSRNLNRNGKANINKARPTNSRDLNDQLNNNNRSKGQQGLGAPVLLVDLQAQVPRLLSKQQRHWPTWWQGCKILLAGRHPGMKLRWCHHIKKEPIFMVQPTQQRETTQKLDLALGEEMRRTEGKALKETTRLDNNRAKEKVFEEKTTRYQHSRGEGVQGYDSAWHQQGQREDFKGDGLSAQ